MLAKALAKCLASLDQDREVPYGSPLRMSPFSPPDGKQKGTVEELKRGILVTKLSWRGPYERTLQLEDRSIATLDPADSRVTNRWALTDVLAVRSPPCRPPACRCTPPTVATPRWCAVAQPCVDLTGRGAAAPQVTTETSQLSIKLAATACLSCGLMGDSLRIECASDARAAALRDGIAIACHEFSLEKAS